MLFGQHHPGMVGVPDERSRVVGAVGRFDHCMARGRATMVRTIFGIGQMQRSGTDVGNRRVFNQRICAARSSIVGGVCALGFARLHIVVDFRILHRVARR